MLLFISDLAPVRAALTAWITGTLQKLVNLCLGS